MRVHISLRRLICVFVLIDDLVGALLPLFVVLDLVVDLSLVQNEAAMSRLLALSPSPAAVIIVVFIILVIIVIFIQIFAFGFFFVSCFWLFPINLLSLSNQILDHITKFSVF